MTLDQQVARVVCTLRVARLSLSDEKVTQADAGTIDHARAAAEGGA